MSPVINSIRGEASMGHSSSLTRRRFLGGLGAVAASSAVSRVLAEEPAARHRPILCFCCDFNWAKQNGRTRAAMPEDWAEVHSKEYFDYHVRFGNNVTFCQAYCSSGFALYPSKLGPVGKGKAARLFPDLYHLSRDAGMPVWSYFCVGTDPFMAREHPEWIIPGSSSPGHGGFFGPETPRTRLLCDRIREFLGQYPVDWLLLDWFTYGRLSINGGPVQPAPFVKEPFQRIVGCPMPERAEDITPAENLTYKRTVLADQFRELNKAIKDASPETKIIFNIPYRKPREELWVDHPMLNESDGLFAESSDEIVDWLLDVHKPHQRVVTTVIGHGKHSQPDTWKTWYAKGCDFFGYAWASPPDFRPVPSYDKDLKTVREAFAAMNRGE